MDEQPKKKRKMLLAPRRLPSLEMLLADLPMTHRAMAAHLGVTDRTLRNWRAAGDAPRAVLLALFWESRWGQDLVIKDAHNTIQVHRDHAAALARELHRVSELLQRVEGLTDSANTPVFRQA